MDEIRWNYIREGGKWERVSGGKTGIMETLGAIWSPSAVQWKLSRTCEVDPSKNSY